MRKQVRIIDQIHRCESPQLSSSNALGLLASRRCVLRTTWRSHHRVYRNMFGLFVTQLTLLEPNILGCKVDLGLCMIAHGPFYLDGRAANDRIDCLQSSETVGDQPIMLCIPNIQSRASTIKMQPDCKIQATSRCPVPRRIACFKYSPLCRRTSPRGYTRAARTGCGTRT